MQQISTSLALAAILTGASAGPIPPATTTLTPCGRIAAAQTAGNTTVPAQVAYDCFTSVPIGKQEAINLVDSLEPYLEWQSDPTYKANPPASYSFPGYDLNAGLKTVRANLVANKYTSEYAFQSDLMTNVFFPGHDGHFYFYPDLLARATKFGRPKGLVSISVTGSSIPAIKFAEDVTAYGSKALTVTKINGVDASTFISNEAKIGCGSQDADACYNQQFYQKALAVLGSKQGNHAAGGRSAYLYQGSNTIYTMSDGTTRTYENIATIKGNFSTVTDGKTFYKKFCTPVEPPEDNSTPSAVVNGVIPGYPTPILQTSDGIVAGFYLDGKGYEDIAVISLFAFESKYKAEFQSVVEMFFAQARKDGKTKLVVDFQGNGGGYIALGYDFFKQLFPDIEPDGFSRWRANNGFLDVAAIYSEATAENSTFFTAHSWFSWQEDFNTAGKPFTSYKDKFGPKRIHGDVYTNTMQWNLTDIDGLGGGDFQITGYGNRTGYTSPFKAEDIILLYDGYCASTCTVASEMLRIQAGVKSIAMGGRPNTKGMQGVGGVKGSQDLPMDYIHKYAIGIAKQANVPEFADEFDRYTALPYQRATYAAFNVRDQILRDNLQDGTPAQFVYEKADCRLFWTQDMLNDATSVWKAAANAAFKNGKCIEGGISRKKRSVVSAPTEYVSKTKIPIRQGGNVLDVDYTPDVRTRQSIAEQVQKAQ